MNIQIESEILNGMAGKVKYHTKPCPYNQVGFGGIGNTPAMVGSSQCQMCHHYEGLTEDSSSVVCNHK